MTLVSIIFPTSVLPSFPSFLISIFPPAKSFSDKSDSPPSEPSRSSIFPFIPDFNKRHRAAATALSQARQEARDVGVERREGVRNRVKKMAKDTRTCKEDERTTPEQQ